MRTVFLYGQGAFALKWDPLSLSHCDRELLMTWRRVLCHRVGAAVCKGCSVKHYIRTQGNWDRAILCQWELYIGLSFMK